MKSEDRSLRDQYYTELIKEIVKIEDDVPENEKMDSRLLELWKEKIEERVDDAFMKCITSEREDFMLTDEEIKAAFEDAGLEFADMMINSMVDDGLLEISIDKKGTMLCGLTEKGKKLITTSKK